MNDFISNIITEASLDPRIPDGVIDLKNNDHIQVIAEAIYDSCGNESIVNEFLENFVDEGKYPERQAYNKDGWLVTFPSKEYRDAAIKKKTHFGSDPTHGKGGMNLYYKKKGKQKRQTKQATTTTQPTDDTQDRTVASQKNQLPAQVPATVQKTATEKPQGDKVARDARLAKLAGGKAPSPQNPTQKQPVSSTEPSSVASTPTEPVSQNVPAIDVPVITEPKPQYAEISKKFAANKGWVITPYGEYKDATGNTAAVVGLSGEVVPVRNNDREEYKIFAEKNMPA